MKLNPQWRGVALLAGTLLLPLSAAATIPADGLLSSTVTVKYDPSRASTTDGASRLYGSLQSAAARVCRDADTRGLTLDFSYYQCTSSALDDAVRKLDIPAISELHSQRVKR